MLDFDIALPIAPDLPAVFEAGADVPFWLERSTHKLIFGTKCVVRRSAQAGISYEVENLNRMTPGQAIFIMMEFSKTECFRIEGQGNGNVLLLENRKI